MPLKIKEEQLSLHSSGLPKIWHPLLLTTYEEFKISSKALANYLRCELHEVESVLLCKLPLTAEITTRENVIEIKK